MEKEANHKENFYEVHRTVDIDDDLMKLFIDGLEKDFNAIQKAYHNDSNDELKALVHRLHGATCYIHVPKLKASLKQLERDMHNQKTSALLSVDMKLVEDAVEELLRGSQH